MSATLLDLNVMMALAWPSHEHHDAAHRWFRRRAGSTWATCSFTQVGFVRLCANPLVVDPPATPRQAAELLREMIALSGHVFWVDDLDLANDAWPPSWVRGHRQTTDAHLVRLAARHRGTLATFDRGLATILPELVEKIPT